MVGADAIATGNDNWSDANNWVGVQAPANGDDLTFPTGLTGAALTSNNDLANMNYASLTIADTGYSIGSTQGDGITLNGPLDASLTSGSSTFNVPVDFGPTAATITVDDQAAALAMGGVIQGSAGLTKAGNGVLDLSGANTYTGGTTVSTGALLVDGTVGDVTVASGATLGGSGTVASITSNSATVSPGDSATTTGILKDSGAFSTGAGSSFAVTINGTTVGTNYDQLVAGGAINLTNAALNVSIGSFTPVPGEQFTILRNTPGTAITGNFLNQAEGSTVVANGHDFSISYVGGGGHDVVLTAISPPTSTWTGNDAVLPTPNDNWSDANNWTPSTVAPSAGYSVIFQAGRTARAAHQQQRHHQHDLQLDHGRAVRLQHHGRRHRPGRHGRRLAGRGQLDDRRCRSRSTRRGDDDRR